MGLPNPLQRIAGRLRRLNGQIPGDLELLRKRDGDHCWLCGGAIQFKARANSNFAQSIEHLVPLSKGGSTALSNKVLCHCECNRTLGALTLDEKEEIRAQRQRKRRKNWKGR